MHRTQCLTDAWTNTGDCDPKKAALEACSASELVKAGYAAGQLHAYGPAAVMSNKQTFACMLALTVSFTTIGPHLHFTDGLTNWHCSSAQTIAVCASSMAAQ